MQCLKQERIIKKAAAARERPSSTPLEEAVALLKKMAYAKFNETVEVSMKLGVDPKHADQMVRGTVVLPNGLGTQQEGGRNRHRGEGQGSPGCRS